MLYNDRNETDLYDCFSEDELRRLREIKDDPEWLPRQQRKAGGMHRDDQHAAQINVVLPARLKARVVEKCGVLGITLRDYFTALLEATT